MDNTAELVACMEHVALAIWGTPSDRNKRELRFGSKGSIHVDLEKGTWFDFEAQEGGGVIDALKKRMDGIHDDKDAFDWLEDHHLYKGNGSANGSWRSNKDRQQQQTPPGDLIATYFYTDEDGKLLFEVQRFLDHATGKRNFRQRSKDTAGKWANNIKGIRRVPYRLPDLITARNFGQTIFIVEGEKDVDNCFDVLGPATCNPMGAGKWPKMAADLNPHFQNANIVIIGDNDEAGRKHALEVARELSSIAASTRVVDLKEFWPDCPLKGDVSDWIAVDGDGDALLAYIDTLPFWTSTSAERSFIQSSAQFVKDFSPPDYLIGDVLQRRFLYALTGKTGSGKTAIAMLLAACVALGRSIGEIPVEQGRVLYLAGENPDDVRMRWIAMSQHMDFDVDTIDVFFIPGRFKISEMRERIVDELQRIGNVSLIVVDTSAAYYEGDEVNSNTQQGEHARMLRTLVGLPGGPCVLVNAHPVKNASPDNLLPLGAGAFLNEIDGNLTCAVDGPSVEIHWQGKMRGPDFEPLSFQIISVTHQRLVDSKGHKIPTVIAKSLSEVAKAEMTKAMQARADQLLLEIDKDGKGADAEFARRCGWLSRTGQPQKSTISRLLKELRKMHLIADEPDGYSITEKHGRKRVAELKEKAEKNTRNALERETLL